MSFILNQELAKNSIIIAELELSTLLLKNDSSYPWLILVPRIADISELHQLNNNQQQILMYEINKISLLIQKIFKPTKINIGALGNIVSQLHIHLIARFMTDPTWPHSVWQPNQKNIPYGDTDLANIVSNIKKLL
jgi:diadenosine tetraphosphate (Ap4A) HIT family hydrolase